MKNAFLLIPLVLIVLAVANQSREDRKQTEWASAFHQHSQDVLADIAAVREVTRLQEQPTTEARRQALVRARQDLKNAIQKERADRVPLAKYFRSQSL